MFRREHQKCTAVKRVGSGSENANLLIHVLNFEIDFRAYASADPVALEQFDSFGPIKSCEFVEQSLRIRSDTQHPLPHRSSYDREAANFAFSSHNFLICQDCAQLRTPVHWNVSNVSKSNAVRIGSAISGNRLSSICFRVEPGVVDLEENPLRPFVISRVRRVDLPLPIVGKTNALQLTLELDHVFTGGNCRMLTGFDRVLLRRQTKCVPAHRVQHIEAAHPLITRDNVSCRVAFRMPNVEASSARIREHIEHVEFWLCRIKTFLAGIGSVKNLPLIPDGLPFWLNLIERIWLTAVATHCR